MDTSVSEDDRRLRLPESNDLQYSMCVRERRVETFRRHGNIDGGRSSSTERAETLEHQQDQIRQTLNGCISRSEDSLQDSDIVQGVEGKERLSYSNSRCSATRLAAIIA